jgi:hypothetical protein
MLHTLLEIWRILQSMHGAGGLATVAAAVQIVMLYLKSNLSDGMSGQWKLAVVTGLSVLGSILAGLMAGLPLLEVLASGPILAAVQVFINQVYSVILKPKMSPPPVQTKKVSKKNA